MVTATVNQPSSNLMSLVDVQDSPPEYQTRPRLLLHFSNSLGISKPFDTGHIIQTFNGPIRLGHQWFSYDWMAALYIVAKNSPPIWYQIELKIIKDAIKWVDDKAVISSKENNDLIKVTKLISERPIVAWTSHS